MAVMVMTCDVEDGAAWEAGFRSHADLFRSMTITKMQFAVEGNSVWICSEIDDLDAWKKVFESEETAAAMKQDGVKADTVRFAILDKNVEL